MKISISHPSASNSKELGFWLCPTMTGSNKIVFHLVPKLAYPHTPPTLLLSEPCSQQQIGKSIEHEFTWFPSLCQHDFKLMNSRETVSHRIQIAGCCCKSKWGTVTPQNFYAVSTDSCECRHYQIHSSSSNNLGYHNVPNQKLCDFSLPILTTRSNLNLLPNLLICLYLKKSKMNE
jgi:hypothetical protein